jgi:hypothetical protein
LTILDSISISSNLKTDYNDIKKNYIDSLEVFADYIGYEIEIKRYAMSIGNDINHKISFKKKA